MVTWHDVFTAPTAGYFGYSDSGMPRDSERYYVPDHSSVDSAWAFKNFSIEVSNNQMVCKLSRTGVVSEAMIVLDNFNALGPMSGNFGRKTYRHTNRARFGPRVKWGGVNYLRFDSAAVDYVHNVFPLFRCVHNELRTEMLVYAPVDSGVSAAPRAILFTVRFTNTTGSALGVQFQPGQHSWWQSIDRDAIPQLSKAIAMLCLEKDGATFDGTTYDLELAAGSSKVISYALVCEDDEQKARQTCTRLTQKSSLDWLNSTDAFYTARYGSLSIPDGPYYAESFVRLLELCRNSLLYRSDGAFGGGNLGSAGLARTWNDSLDTGSVWIADIYYPCVPMSHFVPELARDAIRFFMDHGRPEQSFGRGTNRFPRIPPVVHSLTNGMAAYKLAGLYYRTTRDRDFFSARPEILDAAKADFDTLLSLRENDSAPYLFPSLHVSDGPARGDYHTGSNASVWMAVHSMAVLAEEVYGRDDLAREWRSLADSIKGDVLQHCATGTGADARLVEGANSDGTLVDNLHDGEESETNLMPFFGMVQSGYGPLLRHASLGLSSQNVYYDANLDGILWWDGRIHYVTFPGYVTGVVGALTDEQATLQRLLQIRHMTDFDGSIWWYAHEKETTDPENITRIVAKSSWAAGAYTSVFLNDILGLHIDGDSLSVRPFCPWNSYTWNDCRLGENSFDIAYRKDGAKRTVSVANKNGRTVHVAAGLVLPDGAAAGSYTVLVNGTPTDDFAVEPRHGRDVVVVARPVAAGGDVRVECTDGTANGRDGAIRMPTDGWRATYHPGSRLLRLECESDSDVEVSILDIGGRVVLRERGAGKRANTTHDLSRFGKGTYFVHISRGRDVWKSKLVIY